MAQHTVERAVLAALLIALLASPSHAAVDEDEESLYLVAGR